MSPIELIAAVVACLMVQAFFAASEIALVSADELKVRAESAQGSAEARALAALLARRDRLLALTLTSNNLATVIAAVTLTSFLHMIRPAFSVWAPIILAPMSLLLGESLPKQLTLRNPTVFARYAAPFLRVLAIVLGPLLAAETLLTRGIRALFGVSPEGDTMFLSREDLARVVRRRGQPEAQHDAILPAERQMISRIFRFSRADARKAMVPLVRVDAVPEETTVAGAIEMVRREGFSRLPVFRGRITDIVGIVHVFDLLQAPDLARPVRELMRQVSYFPESMPLDEVLVALKRTGGNLAVIVDEYGGAAGIITLEDLLEEIVGEIEDEHDLRENLVRIVNRRTLQVAARTPIAELNDRFSLRLPEGDEYATIGGLVVERLGHIPQPGEQLKVGEVDIAVTRSDARAVRELRVQLNHQIRVEQLRHR